MEWICLFLNRQIEDICHFGRTSRLLNWGEVNVMMVVKACDSLVYLVTKSTSPFIHSFMHPSIHPFFHSSILPPTPTHLWAKWRLTHSIFYRFNTESHRDKHYVEQCRAANIIYISQLQEPDELGEKHHRHRENTQSQRHDGARRCTSRSLSAQTPPPETQNQNQKKIKIKKTRQFPDISAVTLGLCSNPLFWQPQSPALITQTRNLWRMENKWRAESQWESSQRRRRVRRSSSTPTFPSSILHHIHPFFHPSL